MSRKRRKLSPEFKSRVALEALSGNETMSELASKYGVHPNQISTWKKQAREGIVDSFSSRKKRVKGGVKVYHPGGVKVYQLGR